MAGEEDWLMRPTLPGNQMCKYESLKDGSLTLGDIARMHDALDVQSENQRRYNEWVKVHGGS